MFQLKPGTVMAATALVVAETRQDEAVGRDAGDRLAHSRRGLQRWILLGRTTHQEEHAMDNVRKFSRMLATIVAVLVAAGVLALAPGASAGPAPPTLNALHAFVGDPLFGLDTPQGTLLGIKPDEQSAMASVKKVWLLDLAAHALAEGAVDLGDLVTITKFEAGIGGSSMSDVNGTPLEEGEVVKFDDLIRGMMYPSGNNATYAVARHVAQGYFGPAADWKYAVTMMNGHAAAFGQTDTHLDFTPYHDDDRTTARELTEEFQHGLQDPYFAKVVGFTGTYTATTQGPNGPKTYMWTWGRNYPGWEGEKGGSGTKPCDGPNEGCGVVAATRVGRRVVVSAMQQGGNDLNDMLDYGFASIFHPDPRGKSAPAGLVDRHALDCYASNRALTATLPNKGPVNLALWNVNVDGSTLEKLTEASLPASGNMPGVTGDVAVSRLPSGEIILATRQGMEIMLSRWSYTRAGTLQLVASGINAGPGTAMGLQSLTGDTFLTTIVDPNGDLVLKSWRLPVAGGILTLDTYVEQKLSVPFNDVKVSAPLQVDIVTGHRAMTAAQEGSFVRLDTWSIDEATGTIARITFAYLGNDAAGSLSLTPFNVRPIYDGELFPPPHYAVAWRSTNGGMEIHLSFATALGIQSLSGEEATLPGNQIELAPLGAGGLMSMTTDGRLGNAQLVSWDAFRKNDGQITLSRVSEHDPPATSSFDLCRLPAAVHAEGDFVTATRDTDGQLRLRAYRVGDRPY